jgi:uncharacterized membrane protein YdbT with pleckstrin-like domain
MLPLGREQYLGYKAFFLLALRRVAAGIVLFILVSFITVFSHYLLNGLIDLITNAGVSKIEAGNIASMILLYTILIIFWLAVLIIFLGVLISYLEYINHTYTFNEFDIIMREGILDKKETSIPYRQIQDVNIDRSLVYQILGLSDLILRTAGTEEKNEHGMTDINIGPIDKDTAEEIKTMLERKIGVQVTEDEVKADKEQK